jgi:hypothetical protein
MSEMVIHVSLAATRNFRCTPITDLRKDRRVRNVPADTRNVAALFDCLIGPCKHRRRQVNVNA